MHRSIIARARIELIFAHDTCELLAQQLTLIDFQQNYAGPGTLACWTAYLDRQLLGSFRLR